MDAVRKVRIPMSDGVRLAADLDLPPEDAGEAADTGLERIGSSYQLCLLFLDHAQTGRSLLAFVI